MRTYKSKYNQNHGYIASRKVRAGQYKGDIIVLYDNRDGIQCGDTGKYVLVNETLSKIGFSCPTKKAALNDLRLLAIGLSDYQF